MALMLSFSHNLLVETAVTKRLGVSYWGVMAYRVGLAVVAALLLNGLTWLSPIGVGGSWRSADGLHGGGGRSSSAVAAGAGSGVASAPRQPSPQRAWVAGSAGDWVGAVLTDAAGGCRDRRLLIAIIIPLMATIEALRRRASSSPFPGGSNPTWAGSACRGRQGFPCSPGLSLALRTGPASSWRPQGTTGFPRGDRRLLCVFLVACHAAIEDTLLFVPLGVNPFLLLGTGSPWRSCSRGRGPHRRRRAAREGVPRLTAGSGKCAVITGGSGGIGGARSPAPGPARRPVRWDTTGPWKGGGGRGGRQGAGVLGVACGADSHGGGRPGALGPRRPGKRLGAVDILVHAAGVDLYRLVAETHTKTCGTSSTCTWRGLFRRPAGPAGYDPPGWGES